MTDQAQLLPGNSRSPHPEGGLARPAARLRRAAAHRADFRKRAADRTGRALSRTVSPGAPGSAEGELGHVREQPPRQVLRTDGRRAASDCRKRPTTGTAW